MLSKYLWMAVILFLLLVFSGCYLEGDAVKNSFVRTFQVKPGGNLILETDIGSIEVNSGSDEQVTVEVFRRVRSSSERKAKRILEDLKIEMKQNGNDVIIDADYKRSRRFFSWFGRNRLRVRFVITVPSSYNVDLRTSGGSISVNNLEGEVKTRTSGGSLKYGIIKGPVTGRTSGGSIVLKGCVGDAEVRTSGGSITIGTVEGDVFAHTSGGSIRVEEVMGTLRASTSGGSIRALISRQPKGDCRLTTSGGSITLSLDATMNVDLDAKTSGGRVRTNFPVTLQGVISRRILKGQVNGGGPEIYLRTSGGNITIQEIK
jgi:DUF4097 and DUF4098 domain-containing protein YvlB